MVRLRINVGFPQGPEGRVTAIVYSFSSDVKAWIPESTIDNIGLSNEWSDVETTIDTLNPDGIVE